MSTKKAKDGKKKAQKIALLKGMKPTDLLTKQILLKDGGEWDSESQSFGALLLDKYKYRIEGTSITFVQKDKFHLRDQINPDMKTRLYASARA